MLTAQPHRRPDSEHKSQRLRGTRAARPCTSISCKLLARARSMQHVGVRDLDLWQLRRRAEYLIDDGDPVSVGVVFFLFGCYICIAVGQQRALDENVSDRQGLCTSTYLHDMPMPMHMMLAAAGQPCGSATRCTPNKADAGRGKMKLDELHHAPKQVRVESRTGLQGRTFAEPAGFAFVLCCAVQCSAVPHVRCVILLRWMRLMYNRRPPPAGAPGLCIYISNAAAAAPRPCRSLVVDVCPPKHSPAARSPAQYLRSRSPCAMRTR
jgi:hypothetical protein